MIYFKLKQNKFKKSIFIYTLHKKLKKELNYWKLKLFRLNKKKLN